MVLPVQKNSHEIIFLCTHAHGSVVDDVVVGVALVHYVRHVHKLDKDDTFLIDVIKAISYQITVMLEQSNSVITITVKRIHDYNEQI